MSEHSNTARRKSITCESILMKEENWSTQRKPLGQVKIDCKRSPLTMIAEVGGVVHDQSTNEHDSPECIARDTPVWSPIHVLTPSNRT